MHLYVHVPFCARKCSYCDFAIAVRRQVPTEAYVGSIRREWEAWQKAGWWAESPGLDTIYFGGGTPSRLDPEGVAAMIAGFRAERTLTPGAEVTLEVNPDDVDRERALAWRAAGVNRVSLGAQAFDPGVLAWMHRTHDADRTGLAVETLRSAGIANLSLDLIYAVPERLGRDWDADLARALALRPDHLSLYGLTVEPATPLGKWTARGESVPSPEGRAEEEYLTAHRALERAGYEHYEVSNAARPGARARHNAAYWRRAPFIGLGPSAHSGCGRSRRWNVREWEEYRRRTEAGEPVLAESETLSDQQVALEELYLGLRTRDGVDAGSIPRNDFERWREAGWAVEEAGRVRLLAEGWLRLDALVGSLSHC